MDTTLNYLDSPVCTSGAYKEDYRSPVDINGMDDELWMYLSSLEDDGSIAPFSDMVSSTDLTCYIFEDKLIEYA